jgi:hypothetical protein
MEINSKIWSRGKDSERLGGGSNEADTTKTFLTSQNILPAVIVTIWSKQAGSGDILVEMEKEILRVCAGL